MVRRDQVAGVRLVADGLTLTVDRLLRPLACDLGQGAGEWLVTCCHAAARTRGWVVPRKDEAPRPPAGEDGREVRELRAGQRRRRSGQLEIERRHGGSGGPELATETAAGTVTTSGSEPRRVRRLTVVGAATSAMC